MKRCIIIKHTVEAKPYIQAFNMFIVIYQANTIGEIKYKRILIFRKSCPTTSCIVATFHPTIGQCAHQSLSNTATLELGMIPTRSKGKLAGSHIAKCISKFSQANTVEFIRIQRSWKG